MRRMTRKTSKPRNGREPIFISYASEDCALADSLSTWLKDVLDVGSFMAKKSIGLGENFRIQVDSALQKCEVGIVLITPKSFSREWVHFEAGAMAMRGILLIPVCFWAVTKRSLPSTLNCLEACDWASEPDRKKLVADLADRLGASVRIDDKDKERRIKCPGFGTADLPQYVQYGLSGAFWVPKQPLDRDDRFFKALRESESNPDEPFRLVATSGGAYLTDEGAARHHGFDQYFGKRKMNIVLQSPFCEFAIARALACDATSHHWSRVYDLGQLKELTKMDFLSIRVTELPINGSFFLTEQYAFFDPYIWGAPDGAVSVERNFWVFEFERTGDTNDAYCLLSKHFDFLSRHSRPLREFLAQVNYQEGTREFRSKVRDYRAAPSQLEDDEQNH